MTNQTPWWRPRVLHMAYACAPGYGSEPGVGWNRALQTAKHCDTWVICEEGECGPPIRQYLGANGPVPGLTFVFLPLSRLQKFLMRLPGLYWVAYNRWHRRAFQVAQRLHEQVHFDLVHQVNLNSFREPGYLWKLEVPFVWGPVGGTQNYPWAFLKATHLRGALSEIVRTWVNNFQLHFSRRVRQATRKAAALLTANSTGQGDFARVHAIEPILLLETGLRQVADRPRTRPRHGQAFRILWSGEFSTRKALPLLIHALAQLAGDIRFELRVLGDGPLKARWQRLADKTKVGACTTWLGWVPLQEALEQYTWADAFAFTSLRDTSGNVVLEALSAGLPVICLAHQGVGDVVTDSSGIRVPVTNPRAVIDRLTEAVALLARNPAKWEELSRGAVERAREYLWERQEKHMLAIYRRALQGRVVWLEEAAAISGAIPGAAVTAG